MADFIPILDVSNKLERKRFALKHIAHAEGEFWNHACFGDEQRFAYDSNGHIFLYTGSHGVYIRNTVAVWGCVSADRLQVIKNLHARLDTQQYIDLLRCNVLPYLDEKPYVHDYFPVHTANAVQNFFSSNGMNVMKDWPKKSGDLMPLEKVWREIVDRLHSRRRLVFNCEDLWCAVNETWALLVEEGYIVNIIKFFLSSKSLPQTLKSILETDGDWVIV